MEANTILIQVNEGEEGTAEKAAIILKEQFPEHRIIIGVIKR